MEERVNQSAPPVEVVDIQFRPGQKVYFFDRISHIYIPPRLKSEIKERAVGSADKRCDA